MKPHIGKHTVRQLAGNERLIARYTPSIRDNDVPVQRTINLQLRDQEARLSKALHHLEIILSTKKST